MLKPDFLKILSTIAFLVVLEKMGSIHGCIPTLVYLRLFVLLVIADSKHHYLDNMSPDSKFQIAPTTQRSSSNHSGRIIF